MADKQAHPIVISMEQHCPSGKCRRLPSQLRGCGSTTGSACWRASWRTRTLFRRPCSVRSSAFWFVPGRCLLRSSGMSPWGPGSRPHSRIPHVVCRPAQCAGSAYAGAITAHFVYHCGDEPMNHRRPEFQAIDLAAWPTVAYTGSIIRRGALLKRGRKRWYATLAENRRIAQTD
jgi:hypothetical protein